MRRYEKYKPSGVEWLGEIPEHWEVKRVKDIFREFGSGTTPSTANVDYYEDGNVNWLNTNDLSNDLIYETKQKITKKAHCKSVLSLIGASKRINFGGIRCKRLNKKFQQHAH